MNLFAVDLRALAGIVNLLDRLPDELLTVDEAKFATFVAARESLRFEVTAIPPSTSGRAWPRQGGCHVLCALRKLLAECPDEPLPAAGSDELAFIDDKEWRGTLLSDLGYVEAALHNREWKAATVLGGSLVEALLLWAVSRYDEDARRSAIGRAEARLGKRLPANPESWDLIDYIEVARELEEISEISATQARLAKDFRNLIHPGRERRQGVRCDRGTAYSVVAAVDHVIRDLSERRR